jgi:hypothetical protein
MIETTTAPSAIGRHSHRREGKSLLPWMLGRVLVVTTRDHLARVEAEAWRRGMAAGMRAEHAAPSLPTAGH